MFLFDSVDRAFSKPFSDSDKVPENVKKVYHAIRNVTLANLFSVKLVAAERELQACKQKHRLPMRRSYEGDLIVDEENVEAVVCPKEFENFKYFEEQDEKVRLVTRTSVVINPRLLAKYGFGALSINFGNSGTAVEDGSKTNLETMHFLGSHGAIGGVPIKDNRAPQELQHIDAAAVVEVRKWMWKNFRAEKLSSRF